LHSIIPVILSEAKDLLFLRKTTMILSHYVGKGICLLNKTFVNVIEQNPFVKNKKF